MLFAAAMSALASASVPLPEALSEPVRQVCERVIASSDDLAVGGRPLAFGPKCETGGTGSMRCTFGPPTPVEAAAVLRATGADSVEIATMPVYGAHQFARLAPVPCDGAFGEDCLRLLDERAGRVSASDMVHVWPDCREFHPPKVGGPCRPLYDEAAMTRLVAAMAWSSDLILWAVTRTAPVAEPGLEVRYTTWTARTRGGDPASGRALSAVLTEVRPSGTGLVFAGPNYQCGFPFVETEPSEGLP